ncbi:hypothetical protein FSP39_021564 [Pinctada imbricata]|uniref:Carboxylic ester hydrolase n=1 Tax=Pinctada imbricata TaxID=66713 RepID=A0AA88XP97_PINIB|nr:hypothetical protein FSP39_021564 [Pinctada imbricata]
MAGLFLLILRTGYLYADSNSPIVDTPSGKVKGIRVDVDGLAGAKTVQFRGIPFAKPPVGDLRFEKPQPVRPWNETKDASVFGPSCVQPFDKLLPYKNLFPNLKISEDCLVLNIYAPNDVDNQRNKTVMVWIHGGGYVIGQGMFYDPSYMAVKGDVIVVTINYRLGVFGFATLKNEILKGNYGLWDQIEALKWIKQNIYAFGGDTNSITIFGESAGGFSVSLLALIPSNKGLFHRVIAQSGVASSIFATAFTEPNYTLSIGKQVGCNDKDPKAFVNCLKGMSADLLPNVTKAFDNVIPDVIHILGTSAPVVDNEVLTDLPENLLKNTKSDACQFFKSLDIMFGNVKTEGSLILGVFTPVVQNMFNFNGSIGLPYDVFCDNIVKTLVNDYFSGISAVKDAICTEYGVRYDQGMQGMGAVDMFTDLFFMSVGVSTLRNHALSNPNVKRYQYIFTKEDKITSTRPSWFHGASHGNELPYLFDLRRLPALLNVSLTSYDLILSDKMIAYWTNFAKTG